MANEKNLIPNEERTPEERRENARKAGIASGAARRERKLLKDIAETVLAMPLNGSKKENLEAIQNYAELKGKNLTVKEAMLLAQLKNALDGDLKAFEAIRDLIGEKPPEW